LPPRLNRIGTRLPATARFSTGGFRTGNFFFEAAGLGAGSATSHRMDLRRSSGRSPVRPAFGRRLDWCKHWRTPRLNRRRAE
jgi:hypothetical protein